MVNRTLNGKEVTSRRETADAAAAELLADHAQLARRERKAALRVLAGRLAHQMRNPLAAIQAACSSLRSEIDDTDHLERLDLTMHEVGRLLGLITAEIQTFSKAAEYPREIDVVASAQRVIRMVAAANPATPVVTMETTAPLHWVVAPNDFQVGLFSLLSHLVEHPDIGDIALRIDGDAQHLRVSVRALGVDGLAGPAMPPQPLAATIGVHDGIGLYVAERFARDQGGRLTHRIADDTAQIITLEIPRRHG